MHAPQDAQTDAQAEPGMLWQRVGRPRRARDQQPAEHPVPAQDAQEGVDAAADGDAALPGGIGEGQVLDDPDQAVAAVHGEVDPGRRAGVVIPRDQHGEKRKRPCLLEVDHPGELPRPRPAAEVVHHVVGDAPRHFGPGRCALGPRFRNGNSRHILLLRCSLATEAARSRVAVVLGATMPIHPAHEKW